MKKKLGLYLHIPFCRSKCYYCDFCSFLHTDSATIGAYVNMLCRDIREWGKKCRNFEVDTVYFGGGTPTLLDISQFAEIIGTVYNNFSVVGTAEISTECNPGTVNPDKLRGLRQAGINRLSVGVQSTDRTELRLLGRIHTPDEALKVLSDAAGAGFDNISADIMYGIPGETVKSLIKTASDVLFSGVQHISAYCLKVEENTNFGRRKDLVLPDDDTQFEMYRSLSDHLGKYDIMRYEISNFARPGYESAHNLKYWKYDDYLGLGVAAHSFLNGSRFENSRDIGAYLRSESITSPPEHITGKEAECEYIMLRMRLAEGICVNDFNLRFGTDFDALYRDRLEKYVRGNFVISDNSHYRFTTSGIFVSNTILSDILDWN